jgi:hypothetical protein
VGRQPEKVWGHAYVLFWKARAYLFPQLTQICTNNEPAFAKTRNHAFKIAEKMRTYTG